MSPEEIVRYYKSGNLGSFSTALFELFMRADSENQFKLMRVYPEYYMAYRLWSEGNPND
jgi:hypothetical protein